jgi:NADPH:quinone reductase-like Zn-dependent oxidoreductase
MSTTYNAAALRAHGALEIVERQEEPLEPGEVRIAVYQCGVSPEELAETWRRRRNPSGTSWHVGLEVFGIVTAAVPFPGEQPAVREGDFVVASVVGAGMAEQVVTDARLCRKMPAQGLLLDYPALIGAPLAGSVAAVAKAGHKPGDHVTVVGGGFRACATTAILAAGSNATVTGIAGSRQEADSLRRFGASHTVRLQPEPQGRREALVTELAAITGGALADRSYAVTGALATIGLAAATLRTGGQLVLPADHPDLDGLRGKAIDVCVAPACNDDEFMDGLDRALRMVARGLLPSLDPLVTPCALDDLPDMFRGLAGPGASSGVTKLVAVLAT